MSAPSFNPSKEYHTLDTIEELNVEITNRCNAGCPMCPRTEKIFNDKNSLKLAHWSIDDALHVFSPKLKNLKNILFCGVDGDPASAPNALELVETAKVKTNASIDFYTNGSIRSSEWWKQLAKILTNRKAERKDKVIFSIDGLDDTNHLYRRNTNFKKIISNASSYIQAGGLAGWDYLVFKHNEHQVEDAKKMALALGFKNFRIRKTNRFAFKKVEGGKYPVLNSNSELEYYIEEPENKNYKNQEMVQFKKQISTEFSPDFDQNKSITCLNRGRFQRMFVDSQLRVFPCCFIAGDFSRANSTLETELRKKVFDQYEDNFNSLRKTQWEDILIHPWFRHDLVNSWSDSGSKLTRCVRNCAAKTNHVISQTESYKL